MIDLSKLWPANETFQAYLVRNSHQYSEITEAFRFVDVARKALDGDEDAVVELLGGMAPAMLVRLIDNIFANFCPHCGSDSPRCPCWDD